MAILVAAAASGQYPNLAAALTAPAAPPDDSEVFEAYLMRLIDGALGTSA